MEISEDLFFYGIPYIPETLNIKIACTIFTLKGAGHLQDIVTDKLPSLKLLSCN